MLESVIISCQDKHWYIGCFVVFLSSWRVKFLVQFLWRHYRGAYRLLPMIASSQGQAAVDPMVRRACSGAELLHTWIDLALSCRVRMGLILEVLWL